jgi:hypothetical protein
MAGKWKWFALVLLAIVIGVAVYSVQPVLRQAKFGTDYVAKRACLCVFASERPLVHCILEMPEVMGQVEAQVLEEEKAVRANISFVASSTARYSEDAGCRLD